jgi:ATP-dependent DNA ligase
MWQSETNRLSEALPGRLPGIFEQTIFSPWRQVAKSVFIKAMHPKTEIQSSRTAIEKILKMGWVGQTKIHGHRAQIHLNPNENPIAYNRQGKPHKKLLPPAIITELMRVIDLESDWTVVDAEWLKPENKLFIFDILKQNGKLLTRLNYSQRYKLLPRDYLSPHIQTLPLLLTVEKCMEVLAREEEHIEGLVFKSMSTKGFSDTSIVRCRKRR